MLAIRTMPGLAATLVALAPAKPAHPQPEGDILDARSCVETCA